MISLKESRRFCALENRMLWIEPGETYKIQFGSLMAFHSILSFFVKEYSSLFAGTAYRKRRRDDAPDRITLHIHYIECLGKVKNKTLKQKQDAFFLHFVDRRDSLKYNYKSNIMGS